MCVCVCLYTHLIVPISFVSLCIRWEGAIVDASFIFAEILGLFKLSVNMGEGGGK